LTTLSWPKPKIPIWVENQIRKGTDNYDAREILELACKYDCFEDGGSTNRCFIIHNGNHTRIFANICRLAIEDEDNPLQKVVENFCQKITDEVHQENIESFSLAGISWAGLEFSSKLSKFLGGSENVPVWNPFTIFEPNTNHVKGKQMIIVDDVFRPARTDIIDLIKKMDGHPKYLIVVLDRSKADDKKTFEQQTGIKVISLIQMDIEEYSEAECKSKEEARKHAFKDGFISHGTQYRKIVHQDMHSMETRINAIIERAPPGKLREGLERLLAMKLRQERPRTKTEVIQSVLAYANNLTNKNNIKNEIRVNDLNNTLNELKMSGLIASISEVEDQRSPGRPSIMKFKTTTRGRKYLKEMEKHRADEEKLIINELKIHLRYLFPQPNLNRELK